MGSRGVRPMQCHYLCSLFRLPFVNNFVLTMLSIIGISIACVRGVRTPLSLGPI